MRAAAPAVGNSAPNALYASPFSPPGISSLARRISSAPGANAFSRCFRRQRSERAPDFLAERNLTDHRVNFRASRAEVNTNDLRDFAILHSVWRK